MAVDLCCVDPPFNSRARDTTRYTTTSGDHPVRAGAATLERRGADRAQTQAFTDTWTWDDHANQCYEEILTNKNGRQPQQSIALINGLEKVLGKGSLFA